MVKLFAPELQPVENYVPSTTCDVISFNSQGQHCQLTLQVKSSLKPNQNGHDWQLHVRLDCTVFALMTKVVINFRWLYGCPIAKFFWHNLFFYQDEVIKKDYRYLRCSCSKKLMNWIYITSVYLPEIKINIVYKYYFYQIHCNTV